MLGGDSPKKRLKSFYENSPKKSSFPYLNDIKNEGSNFNNDVAEKLALNLINYSYHDLKTALIDSTSKVNFIQAFLSLTILNILIAK